MLKGQEEKQQTAKGTYEEWPPSNKRRYLKNYQLPKLTSPTKLKREEVSKY